MCVVWCVCVCVFVCGQGDLLLLRCVRRLMMEASLKIHNMACVIQENFNSYIDALVRPPPPK